MTGLDIAHKMTDVLVRSLNRYADRDAGINRLPLGVALFLGAQSWLGLRFGPDWIKRRVGWPGSVANAVAANQIVEHIVETHAAAAGCREIVVFKIVHARTYFV